MLVFSAFTPHSPLLLPSINKDQAHKVKKTRAAMEQLSRDLYASHPETIILISEHPTSYSQVFSIAIKDPYTFDLSEFGDFGFTRTLKPDLELMNELQEDLRKKEQPVTLTTDAHLHYASAVPLSLLTEHLPQVRLVPITYCDLDAKTHFQFGQALKDTILGSTRRVAVIVAGDMSHTLSSEAPAGFHKAGQWFDNKIQEVLANKNSAGLLNMNPQMVLDAKQTCYLPLVILFGLLERISVTPSIISYEHPFDVGYLVANFEQK